MHHPLLMRMLHRPADLDEQMQTVHSPQSPLVAELDQGLAVHQFHHEVGAPLLGRAGVVDTRDPGMIHHGQRLALRLKA